MYQENVVKIVDTFVLVEAQPHIVSKEVMDMVEHNSSSFKCWIGTSKLFKLLVTFIQASVMK